MLTITVRASFAATHKDKAEGPHLHGHSFVVSASERDPGEASLRDDLQAVARELDRRDLGEMLVGGEQSYHSVAAWVMERLALRHPRLMSVEVSVADDPQAVYAVVRESYR